MAVTAPDDSVREIQLSGKQLVFVFMAATVAAVVFFLCGVMVGLGVRGERTEASTAPVDAGTTAAASNADQSGRPSGPPTDAAAVNDSLSYHRLLEGQAPPQAKLTPAQPPAEDPPVPQEAAPAPAPIASAAPPPAPAPPPPAKTDPPPASRTATAPPAKPAPSPTPAAEPKPAETAADGGAPYTVQVAAVKDRAAAQAVLGRLTSKGYPAYILDPAPGATAAMFRVRVGKYKDRRDADRAAQRLRKEEQFKPLVTR